MNVAGLEEAVTVTGASPVVDTQATKVSTSFDSQDAREPAQRQQRSVGDARGDAGGKDEPHRRGWQRRRHADRLHGVRHGRPAAVLRGHQRHGRHRRQRQLRRHERVRRSGREHGRQQRRNGAARRDDGVRRQVGRQHLSRLGRHQLLRRRLAVVQHRRGADRARREGRRRPRAARHESPDQASATTIAQLGGYIKKDKLWWFGAVRDTKTKSARPTFR